jgi:hypothetical protein
MAKSSMSSRARSCCSRPPSAGAQSILLQPRRRCGGAGPAQQRGNEPQRLHSTCLSRATAAAAAAFSPTSSSRGTEEAFLLR